MQALPLHCQKQERIAPHEGLNAVRRSHHHQSNLSVQDVVAQVSMHSRHFEANGFWSVKNHGYLWFFMVI